MLDLVGTGSVVGRCVIIMIIIYVCVSIHTIYYAFVYVCNFDIVDYIYGASADTAFYSHIWIWSQFYISKDDYNQKASGFSTSLGSSEHSYETIWDDPLDGGVEKARRCGRCLLVIPISKSGLFFPGARDVKKVARNYNFYLFL
jgi:hypothetical protein